MNQIQEKDWADESWHGHTGMDSTCDYCIINDTTTEQPEEPSEATATKKGGGKADKKPKKQP
jgi:hypothetical protein